MTERLLTGGEVAELPSAPVFWCASQRVHGAMPCVPLGRYRRYDQRHVETWLKECKQPGRAIAL